MPETYDIALAPFPFTNLSSVTLRPVLIVANPYGNDVIIAFISSRSGTLRKSDIKIVASKQNGLRKTSIINCAKLATLDQGMIVGKLGTLEKKYYSAIQKKLGILFNVK